MPRQEGQNSGTAFKHFIEDDRQRFTTKTCRRKEEQFFPAGNGSVMLYIVQILMRLVAWLSLGSVILLKNKKIVNTLLVFRFKF